MPFKQTIASIFRCNYRLASKYIRFQRFFFEFWRELTIITAMVVKKGSFVQIGNMVRKARKMAGLTQLELAELAGIGKTLIFDVENGHEHVQLNNLIQILDVLNIKMDLILPHSDLEVGPNKELKKGKFSK